MNIQDFLEPIRQEEERNHNFLHITANENQMSETARAFLGSKLSERYYMGAGVNEVVDLGHFTALGLSGVEAIISAAREAAIEMLGAADVNLNVLSGVHAMMSAILSTTEPGDVVMTVPLQFGGHFATVGILKRVGRKQVFADFDLESLSFDVEKIAATCRDQKVAAIYLDVSYYLNPHNLTEIRKAVGDEVIIIYDASHTMGLIMGHQFQSPFLEGANVICANTHKTLPGPHKGMIAFRNKELADRANSIIDGCLYSTPHTNHLIALSTTLLEMKEFGEAYAKQIIANSNAIAQAFEKIGYDVRKANTGRYSENHQAHVFVDNKGEPKSMHANLIRNGISSNFEGNELSGGRWFIRIGTQEITRRGMKEKDMETIASLMDRAMRGEDVKEEVHSLNAQFTKIFYSFDA